MMRVGNLGERRLVLLFSIGLPQHVVSLVESFFNRTLLSLVPILPLDDSPFLHPWHDIALLIKLLFLFKIVFIDLLDFIELLFKSLVGEVVVGRSIIHQALIGGVATLILFIEVRFVLKLLHQLLILWLLPIWRNGILVFIVTALSPLQLLDFAHYPAQGVASVFPKEALPEDFRDILLRSHQFMGEDHVPSLVHHIPLVIYQVASDVHSSSFVVFQDYFSVFLLFCLDDRVTQRVYFAVAHDRVDVELGKGENLRELSIHAQSEMVKELPTLRVYHVPLLINEVASLVHSPPLLVLVPTHHISLDDRISLRVPIEVSDHISHVKLLPSVVEEVRHVIFFPQEPPVKDLPPRSICQIPIFVHQEATPVHILPILVLQVIRKVLRPQSLRIEL
mmetsp:Transcript_32745/g.31975  ORF Transcript_32745/g.31975 Transcript_32745/m.31975 type:complete len:392 (+) Transcript_32745:540-1715(+)